LEFLLLKVFQFLAQFVFDRDLEIKATLSMLLEFLNRLETALKIDELFFLIPDIVVEIESEIFNFLLLLLQIFFKLLFLFFEFFLKLGVRLTLKL
jgi:hypothetical protein